MTANGPVVYLLSGLPGSGKTTYARNLEAHGVVRVSVDDAMLAAHGRLGVDYPADEHVPRLGLVLESARTRWSMKWNQVDRWSSTTASVSAPSATPSSSSS